MAFDAKSLAGNEIADDYVRQAIPKGRWSDTWEVFKSSFLKLILINLFILITFVPGVVIVWFRSAYLRGLGFSGPFNPSITYPFYPYAAGYIESLVLNADLMFYSLLIVAGFIASIGLSGGAYSIRKLINTHGKFTVKGFFHGIKVCYFNTLLPVTLFTVFLFSTLVMGDWTKYVAAVGGNYAGAVTAYVFVIIATVLVGLYSAWLFAVGTNYRVKLKYLFKNSFVLMVGTIIQTLFMAAFTMIPVWFFMIGGAMRTISYILFIFIGFSFMLICWTGFTQWAFDGVITPNLKPQADAKSDPKAVMSEAEIKRLANMELLAAGKSDLLSNPLKPIDSEPSVSYVGTTFTRGDLKNTKDARRKLDEGVSAYAQEHWHDPEVEEYNKLFADREKALSVENKKGKKNKKVSADNLLK